MNNHICGCERGGDCTRTSVCQIQAAVADLEGEHEIEVERLCLSIKAQMDITKRYSKSLTLQHKEIERLTEHAAMDKDFILQYQSQVAYLEAIIDNIEVKT